MALSTATVMRTITSVMVIATTVVEPPPEALTTTVTPEQTTAINAPIEKPTTDSIDSTLESMPASSATSNTENSSSVPAHLSSTPISQSIQSPSSAPAPPASSSNSLPAQNTPSSGQFSVSTAVPDLNTPVFDRLHTTTSVPNQNTPVFDRLHTTTSVPNPNTPVFDKQPTRTSVPDLNTPVFDKPLSTSTTPAQTTSVFDKQTTSSSVPAQDTSVTEQPTTSSTSNQEILSSLSSQETSLRATSEPSPQTTQQSSPEVSSSVTSHSVEKAILLPTSTASSQTTLSSSSSESSSTVSSDLPSTFQTSVISTAATSVETTKSSDKTATSDEITNPQTTYTTATLPGGAITSIPLDATAANENAHPSDTNYPIVGGADSSSGNEKTPIIVGGIIGGIAALLAIVILIWFLKRKISRHRRSTLLTPLSLAPGAGGGGRDKYQSNTASLGPTSRTTKLAAALNHYPKKLSEKMSQMPTNNESPGVNMNRGNSQFEPIATHSRHGSVDPNGDTHSERLRGWWSQAIQDASSDDLTEQNITEKPHYAGHPYFANTDDDSQRRRMSQPTSVSSWTDGAPSPNPFTDANAASGRGGVSTYLQDLEGAGNPFADENSITPPAVAQTAPIGNIQEVQRSRPQTVNRGPSSRMMPRSGTLDVVSFYRDSSMTDTSNSFETRRNKIHSNPFDLEIDGSHPSAVPPPLHPVPGAYYDMSRPDTARTRGDSFTSRYTSGTGWNRSTMGAMSSRWGSTVGYVPIGHVRSDSDTSLKGPNRGQGVGQAM